MADHASITFRIPKGALRGLAQVAEYEKRLFEISGAAKEIHPISDPKVLVLGIHTKTQIPQPVLESLLDALSNLQMLRTDMQLSAREVVEAVTKSIEDEADEAWKDQHSQKWLSAKDSIIKWLDESGPDDPIAIVRKIRQLTFSHQKLLTQCSILTDIRPVFNAAGKEILEAIITHSLLLEYRDGSDAKKMELTLDARDLQEIKQACDRAMTKTNTIRKSLKALPFSLVVPRENEIDDGAQP